MKHHVTRRLAANAEVFRHLLAGVSEAQARWKPERGTWSLLEVVNHLADEERDDFRDRIDRTLHHPHEPWPPIDPPRWAVERRYNERDLGTSMEDFLRARADSLRWLAAMGAMDLDATHEHPTVGTMSVGDLLGSWLAHDLFHIRQMNRLHFEYLASVARPYSVDYAGPW